MRRTPVWPGILVVLLALVQAETSSAITIRFVPPASTFEIGDLFDVDVVISGLDSVGEVVSAFDLTVTYGDTVLAATGVTLGSALGFAIETFFLDPGSVTVRQNSLLTDSMLMALQGDTVSLFTLHFQALGPGSSVLGILSTDDAVKGLQDPGTGAPGILPLGVTSGTVDVIGEPAILGLLALGWISLVARKRET